MTTRVVGNADVMGEDVMEWDGAVLALGGRTVGGGAMVVVAGRTNSVAHSQAVVAAIIDLGSRSGTLDHGSSAW